MICDLHLENASWENSALFELKLIHSRMKYLLYPTCLRKDAQ